MTASVVVTVDTEPDNQWETPLPVSSAAPFSFVNTRNLGGLMDHMRRLGLRTTWMTSYSVARDEASAKLLQQAVGDGDEIGAHLHGWETPPLVPLDGQSRPYIYEYDRDTRLAKLQSLTETLETTFGQQPASYRAGRWGIDDTERENIARAGYRIDTSIVPGHDFRRSVGASRPGPDFRHHLRESTSNLHQENGIWEVPVSVGVLGRLPGLLGEAACASLASHVHQGRGLGARAAKRFLSRTGLCRVVWIRPLLHPRADLVSAAVALVERGAPVINIMFHSSEAHAGTSPRSRTQEDVARLFGDIEAVAEALRATGRTRPATLSEAVESLAAEPAA